MLIRQSLLRIPSSGARTTCYEVAKAHISIHPVRPEQKGEKEPVPLTWPISPSRPSKASISEAPESPLLELLPILTKKSSSKRPKGSKDISAFLPQTKIGFYPQEEPVLNADGSTPLSPSHTPSSGTSQLQHSYHFHINSSVRNTNITITNYAHKPIIAISAGRLGLTDAERTTDEAGATTVTEALKQLRERYPKVMKEGRIELILNGIGPAREGALKTILGPLGAEIRNRIKRITDVTTGYRSG